MITLRQWFAAALSHGKIYYLTEHRSRSGMGASYTLWTNVKNNHGETMLELAWPTSDVSQGYDPKLAKALGFRITKTRRAWYRGGCGYDRVWDIVDSIMRHADPGMRLSDVQRRVTLEDLSR